MTREDAPDGCSWVLMFDEHIDEMRRCAGLDFAVVRQALRPACFSALGHTAHRWCRSLVELNPLPIRPRMWARQLDRTSPIWVDRILDDGRRFTYWVLVRHPDMWVTNWAWHVSNLTACDAPENAHELYALLGIEAP